MVRHSQELKSQGNKSKEKEKRENYEEGHYESSAENLFKFMRWLS